MTTSASLTDVKASESSADIRPRAVEQFVRGGTPVRVVARGMSMWPAIRGGAEVEIVPMGSAALRVGEVYAYARDGRIWIHRLIAVAGDTLLFRGDAMNRDDPPVARALVLGRAIVRGSPAPRMRIPRASDFLRLATFSANALSRVRNRLRRR